MRRFFDLRAIALVLVLFGIFVAGAAAEMMDEKKMSMMEMAQGARTGMLHGSEGHHAFGSVTLSTGEDGAVLLLSDLKVDKVPDGRVYLARGGDHRKGVELGKLKQFSGSVSFEVPAEVDAADFDSVVIWCEKFSVEIGRAVLQDNGM